MIEVYKISQMGCLLYLSGMSVLDIKNRRLPVWMLAAGGFFAVVFQVCWKGAPLILVVSGGIVGMIFLAVSKVTKEAFGYGDSVLIGVLGIYLGFWNLLNLLAMAFLLSAVAAIWALAKQKFTRKTVLPFVPFLGTGYLLMLFLGGF